MRLYISEIFYSIQGESTFAGQPCTFIRLSGCNLRCTYCDTAYAYGNSLEMSFQEIFEQVDTFGCPLVEITGGEPLFQKNTPELVIQLLGKGYQVIMETNGSFDISNVDTRCVKIMDIKCPGSGEENHNRIENLKILTHSDQVKFVISDRKDYDFSKNMLPLVNRKIPADHILFSPVHGKIDPADLADWILKDHLNIRLNLQLHKIIWPDFQRGV